MAHHDVFQPDSGSEAEVSPGTSLELELRFIGALVSEDPGETQEALRLAAFICVEAPEGSVAVEHGEAMLFANGTVLQGHEARGPGRWRCAVGVRRRRSTRPASR